MYNRQKQQRIGLGLLGIFLLLILSMPIHELRHGDYSPLTHVCDHPSDHRIGSSELHQDCKLCDMGFAPLFLGISIQKPQLYQQIGERIAVPRLISLDKTLHTHSYQLRAPPFGV